jgi:hypothetical protein
MRAPGRRRLARAAAALAALAAAAAVLSGCVVIKAVTAEQTGVIGPARVTVALCPSRTAGCPDQGNSKAGAENGSVQLLLGYRIPAGATAPARVGSGDGLLTFAASPDYAAELQRLAPAPAGERWVGYLSGVLAYAKAAAAQSTAVPADFGLPADADPYPGPLPYRPVVGVRGVTGQSPATRPVRCYTSLTAAHADGADTAVICVDSPAAAALAPDLSLATRDLAVIPGDPATAAPGVLVGVPFTLRYAGPASASANFALSAASALPGAVVAPSPGSLAPAGGGDSQVVVAVTVPAGAAPGIYDVTLTARLAGGQARTGTAHLVVAGIPGAAPGTAAGGPAEAQPPPPQVLHAAAPRRRLVRLRLTWRRDRRARYYNLQIYQGRRKVASTFPRRALARVQLRPGRYRMVVWSGIGAQRLGQYAQRPWRSRVLVVAGR